jgi:hypothetical protein
MRIALVDRPKAVGQSTGANRFARLADLLRRQGHGVALHDGAPPEHVGAIPILTGLNRAIAARPMIEAHRLALHLAHLAPDLLIAPLGGGIAQGVLMARACGEAFASTRVALWCDTPSRQRFLHTDDMTCGLEPLIADALERQTLALADALIMPKPTNTTLESMLRSSTLPAFKASLPTTSADAEYPRLQANTIEEVVFVGPIQRGAGVVEFLEAVHRLWRDGLLGDRIVTFLGPARSDVQGIGKEWLGLRASRWPFQFKIIDTADPAKQRRYVREAGRLAVTFADDEEDFEPIRHSARRAVVLRNSAEGTQSLTDQAEVALRGALVSNTIDIPNGSPPTDWTGLVAKLAALPCLHPPRPAPAGGITVCVLHYNRTAQLAKALESIPDVIDENPVEIIVLDNASELPFIEDEIRNQAGPRTHMRIVRLARSVPQASALNLGLAEARFETVLFLDDDNLYLPTGVARLARAVATSGFDIVVTTLEIFDNTGSAQAPTAGRLIFLGQPHSAGLFFNAFGDTAMAVRRDTFLAFGGFHDPGYDYPSLDWVTLAKAQATGLRIGAMQWPALRYHRDTARADMAANKLDQEGARLFVFEAYNGAFDAELLARYAQKLHLEGL